MRATLQDTGACQWVSIMRSALRQTIVVETTAADSVSLDAFASRDRTAPLRARCRNTGERIQLTSCQLAAPTSQIQPMTRPLSGMLIAWASGAALDPRWMKAQPDLIASKCDRLVATRMPRHHLR